MSGTDILDDYAELPQVAATFGKCERTIFAGSICPTGCRSRRSATSASFTSRPRRNGFSRRCGGLTPRAGLDLGRPKTFSPIATSDPL